MTDDYSGFGPKEKDDTAEFEKLAAVFNGLADELDDLADEIGLEEEDDVLKAGKTAEEIAAEESLAAKIAKPLVDALDSMTAIINHAAQEVNALAMGMYDREKGEENSACSAETEHAGGTPSPRSPGSTVVTDALLEELRGYIKKRYKLSSMLAALAPEPVSGEIDMGPASLEQASGLLTGFIRENHRYEAFAHALERLRREKDIDPPELYRDARISRQHYSKIMCTPNYRPSKDTAIQFALALRLEGAEFAGFLKNAGFALSDSSVRDLVYRFCVERRIFNLDEVNALLFTSNVLKESGEQDE